MSGVLALSRSGAAVTFGCMGIPAQSGLGSASWPSATFPRIAARITQDGAVDTTARAQGWDGTNAGPFGAFVDDVSVPNRFFMTGATSVNGGMRVWTAGNTGVATGMFPGATLRALFFDGANLYVTYSGNTREWPTSSVRQ